MKTTLQQCSLPPILVGGHAAALINRQALTLAPHVDNADLTALTREPGDKVFTALVAEVRLKVFVLSDETVASQNFEFLGVVLDGTPGRLRHTAWRCWRLLCALTKVMQMRRATGDALRALGRHLCRHFGLVPPALSVLEEIFPWSPQQLGRVASLTYSLLIEQRVALALLFVMGSNFWRDLGEAVFCSDVSSRGYALLESLACAWERSGGSER